jgi:hypothetical protein
MATLTLTKVFVNLLATGASVSAQSGQGREQDYGMAGQVRTYGGGRQRAVSTFGETTDYAFMLRNVPPADLATLRLWKGETVVVRNHKGEKYYGTYFELKAVEYMADNFFDVTIALKGVTATDVV